MNNRISKEELLRRFVENKCTPEERELLFEYLKTTEADTQLHTAIDNEIWELMNSEDSTHGPSSQEMYANIYKSITSQSSGVSTPAAQKRFIQKYWMIAAVFACILLGTAVMYFFANNNSIIMHTTAYGQTTTLILPDSSVVTLNGNSSVRFAPQWPANKLREVWIEGEAYFSVKHKYNNQKFRVYTLNNLNVEVLGTEFNVYSRKTKTRVVLNSGKVSLNIDNKENAGQVTMKPGELVEFKENQQNYIKKGVNAAIYSSWINQKLILDNTSLREIAVLLEEIYGLSVVVPNKSLYNEKFSGIVPCQNADMLLNALAISFNLKIQKNEHEVKFLIGD